MFVDAGVTRESLYLQTEVNGTIVHAYPEDVAMTFLEYYAFEHPRPTEQARQAFRKLARGGLRLFIYTALGYDPAQLVPLQWREFHDRMTLVSAPIGFFSVFKESSEFVINAIRAGLRVDEHTVPDISVGQAWSAHWKSLELYKVFGDRRKHPHNYPEYFKQAQSKPQEMWVYPLDALGEFRRWVQLGYVPTKYPKYLERKVSEGALPASTAQVLLDAAAVDSSPQLNS
ncbi:MAG: hypothetical protein ACRDQZ_09720 [Mycobacteriales bacterium]